ncbi:MAG: Gfo/Idh/MocA family oxidoreductase [Odoribacteraceae bacterium]|jgi:hypothetical protein|nr:Gfo/Idh/MocA family oxidoreductase [Odoribacteraceae bacterium]
MKTILSFIIITTLAGCLSPARRDAGSILPTPVPERPPGQTDVLELRCAPIPVVRVGFIGLGARGKNAVSRFISIEGAEIKALCDLKPSNLDETRERLAQHGYPEATAYTGDDGWQTLCQREDIDLIYICTDWLSHAPIAVYAMEHGKHVAIEVPAATTLEECWALVNTAEKYRRHCMMLENCCYDRFELAALNMIQQGVLGEIVHAEGAYIHDLRSMNSNQHLPRVAAEILKEEKTGSRSPLPAYRDHWRMRYNIEHTGNPYPSHGLGPVCQALNIHRGDKMNHLVSLSSDQFGITAYAERSFGKESPQAKQPYRLGDMNTTIIRTEKGKTILIQHDITSPRPYNRIHLISGTKGFVQKWPTPTIALDPTAHEALSRSQVDSMLTVHEHRFYKEAGERASSLGEIAHGGMDYIMDYRLVYCLRQGLPLDQDVYDAAEWSCLVELTERSVENNGAPVEIPDFTRGAWNKIAGLRFAE